MHKFMEIKNEKGDSFLLCVDVVEAVIPDKENSTKIIINDKILNISEPYAVVKEKLDKATGGIC